LNPLQVAETDASTCKLMQESARKRKKAALKRLSASRFLFKAKINYRLPKVNTPKVHRSTSMDNCGNMKIN